MRAEAQGTQQRERAGLQIHTASEGAGFLVFSGIETLSRWEIDQRADVAPGNEHMRYVLFQLAPVWGNDRAVIVTYTRGLELGVFDPQANRIAPDNLGIKLFLFNAGRLQTVAAKDDQHDRFIHGIINCHPGSPCESGSPMLGFRLHPGFYQYALSPPFRRRMALNLPPCP